MTSDTSVETTLASPSVEAVLVTTDCKGRLRVCKEQRKAVLAKFEQSGMSGAKFAAVAGIKYSTFAGWLQRYRRLKPRVAAKRVRLVEAVIGATPSQEPAARTGLIVHLPGAVRVELSCAAEVPLVAALMEALQKRGLGC
jgi:lambda repressor-like predicted transcriptional regulator